jgi:5-methyltetrahydropteroyltriglutamate--homocysteine methyltransferase
MDAIYADHACASPQFVLPSKALELGVLARLTETFVPEFVTRQADAGLDVVTDGEIHRSTFLSSFWDSVAGLTEPGERFVHRDEDGSIVAAGYADPTVTDRIVKRSNVLLTEIASLRALNAEVPFKITVPAPSYFYTDIVEVASGSFYADRQSLVEDVVAIERELVLEAVAAGATWIQFDFPLYPALCDPSYADPLTRQLGYSSEQLLDRALTVDRQVTADLPDELTVAMHICRGNFEGGFWSGSLEPVAERLFNELPHHRFLIEWEDTEREGDYAPLRFVPPGKVVALGLVSTKSPMLETEDEIVGRLEQASAHLALQQLALCPQCGFASLFSDHLIGAQDAQWRKLELIGKVADRIWRSA